MLHNALLSLLLICAGAYAVYVTFFIFLRMHKDTPWLTAALVLVLMGATAHGGLAALGCLLSGVPVPKATAVLAVLGFFLLALSPRVDVEPPSDKREAHR